MSSELSHLVEKFQMKNDSTETKIENKGISINRTKKSCDYQHILREI